ncbi:hypothetical protein Droror1_Dr00023225 [Drosera rotundifolia]
MWRRWVSGLFFRRGPIVFTPPLTLPAPTERNGSGGGDGGGVTAGTCKQLDGMDHVRVHPKFLHSNATSHKWALGDVDRLLDLFLEVTDLLPVVRLGHCDWSLSSSTDTDRDIDPLTSPNGDHTWGPQPLSPFGLVRVKNRVLGWYP